MFDIGSSHLITVSFEAAKSTGDLIYYNFGKSCEPFVTNNEMRKIFT